MSSGIYVKIKLHPFYQEFLRCHYQQSQPVYSFPPRDRFMMLLEYLLSLPPKNMCALQIPETDPFAFLVEIPTMPHKNPFYYNHISQRSHNQLVSRLTNFVNHLMFDKIGDLRRKGFDKQEVIVILMEEYHVNPKHEEMVIKAYNRAIDAERLRKYRKKTKTQKKPQKSYN